MLESSQQRLLIPRTIAIVIGHGSTKKKRPQEWASSFLSSSISSRIFLSSSQPSHIRFRDFYSARFLFFFPLSSRFISPSSFILLASFAPETYLAEDRERLLSWIVSSLTCETRPWQRRNPITRGVHHLETIRAPLNRLRYILSY